MFEPMFRNRSLFGKRARPSGRKSGSGGRPSHGTRSCRLEQLEDRSLLSATMQFGHIVCDPAPGVRAGATVAPAGYSVPIGLTPQQVRGAYGIDSIDLKGVVGDGAGQTIAILDAYDDPMLVSSTSPDFATSDLHQFDVGLGLPDPPSFLKLDEYGGTDYPAPATGAGAGWAIEESLDVEWAHAIAPRANILLLEANSAGEDDLMLTAADTARDYPGVSVVSMSFGEPEYAGQTAYDSHFTTPTGHNGVTFLAGSGDSGSPGEFPASSPNVVAVGATTLFVDGNNQYVGEIGWSGTGGGPSSVYGIPSYQKAVQNSAWRETPDVSFVGDPFSGVAIYDSFDLGASAPWTPIGGTSVSSPCWAGLIAIADQFRASAGLDTLDGPTQTLPKLYSLPASDFHDVTSGSNGGYNAGPGYDEVTGLGSPVADRLVSDLVAPLSPVAAVTLQTSSTSAVYGQAITFMATVGAEVPGSGLPTGAVTFRDGTTVLGSGPIALDSDGTATIDVASLGVGKHTITASYSGDAIFLAGAGSLTESVNQATTATTLTAAPAPLVVGQSVTLTAVVDTVSPGTGVPTGAVTFKDGTTTLGTRTLDGAGTATFNTTALAAGTHTFSVSYAGVASFGPSCASLIQVLTAEPTALALATSQSGQSLAFTALVSSVAGGTAIPSGKIAVYSDKTLLGSYSLDTSGRATFSIAAKTAAGHTITVNYTGTGSFLASNACMMFPAGLVPTSTVVAASTSPAVFGHAVTFTATVSAALGVGTPTGAVTFTDGAATLGTVPLSGAGTASFSTSTLSVGSHAISAVYSGDSSFAAGSGTLTQAIVPVATTLTLSDSASLTQPGRFVVSALVTAPAGEPIPTGTVTFTNGRTALGTASLDATGTASITVALGLGADAVTAAYAGASTLAASSGTLTQLVSQRISVVSLSVATVSPVLGQSITLQAIVGAGPLGFGTPGGTVTFLDGATKLAVVALKSSDVATFSTSRLAVGNHTLSAVYSGDANFLGSSSVITQPVKPAATAMGLTASTTSPVFGQSVTYTVAIKAAAPGAGAPGGTVTFLDGTTILATVKLDAYDKASFKAVPSSIGDHTITAVYSGNASFSGNSTSLAIGVSQAATTIAVASSLAKPVFGQSVTLTATIKAVSPGVGVPTGSVTFSADGVVLGAVALDGKGHAVLATSALGVGANDVTVSYDGDADFAASSVDVTQQVKQAAVTMSVITSPATVVVGQAVTFSATVAAKTPGVGLPTGTVTFLVDGAAWDIETLDDTGQASFSTAALSAGTHTITVSYSGDSNFTTLNVSFQKIVGRAAARVVGTRGS